MLPYVIVYFANFVRRIPSYDPIYHEYLNTPAKKNILYYIILYYIIFYSILLYYIILYIYIHIYLRIMYPTIVLDKPLLNLPCWTILPRAPLIFCWGQWSSMRPPPLQAPPSRKKIRIWWIDLTRIWLVVDLPSIWIYIWLVWFNMV